MIEQFILKRHVIIRMKNSYFGNVFEQYVLHLANSGYKPDSIKTYCQALEHFGPGPFSEQLVNL